MRPIWKGYITFGLVNIPVILYSAEKRFDISFRLLDSRDHARVRYLRINEKTGEEVPWNEIAKGYEYDKDNYVILKETEIKNIISSHSKEITIECFINNKSLDYVSFEKPYYLVPDNKGEKGYVILRETLKTTHTLGIAKVIIHSREYLSALIPYENALVVNLIRYPQELRKPTEYELPSDSLKAYNISSKEMQMAKELVSSMTVKWNPEDYHDTFREHLMTWIEEQIKEQKPVKRRKSKVKVDKDNIVNFVDILKKSLKERQIKPEAKRKPKAK